jgi:hypothetical protein
MNRKLTAMLAVVLVAVIIFIAFFAYQNRNQTTVSGYIMSDTTWSGTINLTDTVTVHSGVTLKIQPGTTVNFNLFCLRIDGTLIAKGNENQPITFNDGMKIAFSKSSIPWNEQTGSGCIIDNVISEIQYEITGASPKISNNILNLQPSGRSGCIIRIDGGSPIIANNNITGRTLDEYMAPENDAAIYVTGDGNTTITGNIIQRDNTGISVLVDGNGTVTIKRNLIFNTNCGVQFEGLIKVTFEENTITQNSCGLSMTGAAGELLLASNNNIYGNNNPISLRPCNWGWFTVNLSNNWWGTADDEVVSAFVNDVDFTTVTVEPILQAQNPNAPKP